MEGGRATVVTSASGALISQGSRYRPLEESTERKDGLTERFQREKGRRWFVLERPRRDTNGGSETEVTVTSKLPDDDDVYY